VSSGHDTEREAGRTESGRWGSFLSETTAFNVPAVGSAAWPLTHPALTRRTMARNRGPTTVRLPCFIEIVKAKCGASMADWILWRMRPYGGRWESIAPGRAHRPHDIVDNMTDILIRDVPDEVVAAVDANAQRSGQTRAEYLRRLLADQQRPALTREQLNRFAERTADLGNPEVMAAAWR
jgi:hypothetical protein